MKFCTDFLFVLSIISFVLALILKFSVLVMLPVIYCCLPNRLKKWTNSVLEVCALFFMGAGLGVESGSSSGDVSSIGAGDIGSTPS